MSKTTRQRGKAVRKSAARRTSRKRRSESSETDAAPTGAGPMPVAAKGQRARFHADPAVDALLATVAALTAEVSVAFDRIATLERLLERRDVLPADAVESYEADDTENRRRSEAREALIERVFRVIRLQGGDGD